jgi:predicted component of type VI protein secretion system
MEPVQAGARQQLDLTAVNAGVHAVAVVLDLVQPAAARWRLVHQARELRLDPLGWSS